jgi:virginiamycin B lyase
MTGRLAARGSSGTSRCLLPAFLATLAVLCSGVAPAGAYVYWSNLSDAGAIGRADLDGIGVDDGFIRPGGHTEGISVDGEHIYWANPSAGAIGRTSLNGGNVDPGFITGIGKPILVAVDAAHIYWSTRTSRTIGRANLDGTGVDTNFITGLSDPDGVAVDGAHIYWTNYTGGTIGRANLDGTEVDQAFIVGGSEPPDIAVDDAHIYWSNYGALTVGRASLDGTNVDQSFITGTGHPAGVAVDGAHIYWSEDNTVGRANLDGTAPVQIFTTSGPAILAVDALGPPPPPIQGSAVNVVPRTGSVLVRLPTGTFVPLESVGQQIPVGSTLDTRHGTVRLFAATNGSGGTQHGDFRGGFFNVRQGRKNPLTTLSMTGGGLRSCGKVPPGGSPKVAVARKRKRRSLFSSVKGHFRVRGRNSAATVRGTKFTMTDSCAGTRTQVTAGTVLVRDFSLHKTVTVKAGHSYLAHRRGNRR